MKKRADGLYCKQIRINGKIKSFYGKTKAEVDRKLLEYNTELKNGRAFAIVANEWASVHFDTLEHNTLKQYKPAFKNALDWFGEYMVRDITSNDIRRYIGQFSTFAKKLSKPAYWSSTLYLSMRW